MESLSSCSRAGGSPGLSGALDPARVRGVCDTARRENTPLAAALAKFRGGVGGGPHPTLARTGDGVPGGLLPEAVFRLAHHRAR
eukprot:scaffold63493_cov69-Phaeocystis_antarctica.AAC.5